MSKSFAGSLAALAMIAAPVAASAAPVNPAASLSVAKSVRASAPSGKANKAAGGGALLGALIAAGVVAIGVVAIVKDDNSDSN